MQILQNQYEYTFWDELFVLIKYTDLKQISTMLFTEVNAFKIIYQNPQQIRNFRVRGASFISYLRASVAYS